MSVKRLAMLSGGGFEHTINRETKSGNLMSEFVVVAKTSEIPDPGSRLVEVGERLVVLVHVAGRYYAVDDLCTHDGGPLSDGAIDGHAIVCPRHGAKFDVRDGKAVSMPAIRPTMTHEVQVQEKNVLVKLNDF